MLPPNPPPDPNDLLPPNPLPEFVAAAPLVPNENPPVVFAAGEPFGLPPAPGAPSAAGTFAPWAVTALAPNRDPLGPKPPPPPPNEGVLVALPKPPLCVEWEWE